MEIKLEMDLALVGASRIYLRYLYCLCLVGTVYRSTNQPFICLNLLGSTEYHFIVFKQVGGFGCELGNDHYPPIINPPKSLNLLQQRLTQQETNFVCLFVCVCVPRRDDKGGRDERPGF